MRDLAADHERLGLWDGDAVRVHNDLSPFVSHRNEITDDDDHKHDRVIQQLHLWIPNLPANVIESLFGLCHCKCLVLHDHSLSHAPAYRCAHSAPLL